MLHLLKEQFFTLAWLVDRVGNCEWQESRLPKKGLSPT
jgi:hypothetical protein